MYPNEGLPLGEAFYANPHEFMQNYVRNLNNEIFLSEYQINNLHALLLIGRCSPWDDLTPSPDNQKDIIDSIVEEKINGVKKILQEMSKIYEGRVRKNTLNKIEKLMSIIKAKNKRIFIEKAMPSQKKQQNEFNSKQYSDSKQSHNQQENNSQKEVLSLFYGLRNFSNLEAMALGNFIEYNGTERYIKFNMSQNYIMTIKNDDKRSFDLTSVLSKAPKQMLVNHIFPFLTAEELFHSREVCRQWFEYVKQAWHSTFKRDLFIQLLACEFCKDIELYYKLIQLRNPFFQKLSLLLHALIQIIQWDIVYETIHNNTICSQLKKVLIILLRLMGEPIQINHINDINEALWNQHKAKTLQLKTTVTEFLSNLQNTRLSVNDLRSIKSQLLDAPFMRVQQIHSEDKSPLLLMIFVKQLTLQQIIRNHIFFGQEYLFNTKRKLDEVSKKMPRNRGFLESVYKILLLKTFNPPPSNQQENNHNQIDFTQLFRQLFTEGNSNKPDFTIRSHGSETNIFLDKATKRDIIISTFQKCNLKESENNGIQEQQPQNNQGIEQKQQAKLQQEQHIQQQPKQIQAQKQQRKEINEKQKSYHRQKEKDLKKTQ